MSNQYNVEPTAEVIDNMAEELEVRAKELREHAANLRSSGDFDYAAEALATVGRVTTNLRIDLLLTRPIRAITKTRSAKAGQTRQK